MQPPQPMVLVRERLVCSPPQYIFAGQFQLRYQSSRASLCIELSSSWLTNQFRQRCRQRLGRVVRERDIEYHGCGRWHLLLQHGSIGCIGFSLRPSGDYWGRYNLYNYHGSRARNIGHFGPGQLWPGSLAQAKAPTENCFTHKVIPRNLFERGQAIGHPHGRQKMFCLPFFV